MNLFEKIGQYLILMGRVFSKPERWSIYRRRIIVEMESLGVNSIGIVAIISIFIGAVLTLQMSLNLDNAFVPPYLIGYATRESLVLEFSSTIVALILAGKVGSNIASEIGTMIITEQVDALEIMGINSASYLMLPKIIAAMFFFPFLTILSIGIGVVGAYMIITFNPSIMSMDDFLTGLRFDFEPLYIYYSLIKTVVFAFIITSISGYYGYYTEGNSLEVGRASTKAVVSSCITVLIFNLLITQLMLT